MFVLTDYFAWWYSDGLRQFWLWWQSTIAFIWYYFSVGELARTLFNPWKRDHVYYGQSLEAIWHSIIDNLTTRFIGFMMRFFVILFCLLLEIFLIVAAGITLIIYLTIVPLGIFLIIKGAVL